MPRENSFSDTSGRSLTPDLPEGNDAYAPQVTPGTELPGVAVEPTLRPSTTSAPTVPGTRPPTRPSMSGAASDPLARFRSTVHKVIRLHRATTILSAYRGEVGAEPGVDPRRDSAFATYGHLRQNW